jgi:hypothetical protein
MNARTARTNELQQAVSEVEGEIRDFIRRDVSYLRKPVGEPVSEFANNAGNINNLIQRVAGNSLSEIDGLIGELQTVRDVLQTEGERVQREVASYAQLSQAAMTSVKLITDSMAQWKHAISDLRIDRA